MIRYSALALAIVFLITGHASSANEATRSTGLSTPDFHEQLTGTLTTVILHEVAHAVIDVLDPIITGPEEDSADEFAVMMLLAEAERGNSDALAMVEAYASTFMALWQRFTLILQDQREREGQKPNRDLVPLNWFIDEHSFEIKRTINVLCLLYGADPVRGITQLIENNLPVNDKWRQRCKSDYERKKAVWKRVLEPFAPEAKESGVILPGGLFGDGNESSDAQVTMPQRPPEDRPAFRLAYSGTSAQDAGYYAYGNFLSSRYEIALGLISQQLVLPHDIPVISGDCGSPGAFYSPGRKAIVICHEFVALIAADLVRYHTGLDFADWWNTQRAHEVQSDLVGSWQKVDQDVGNDAVLDLQGSGTGEIVLGASGNRDARSGEGPVTFTVYWGVGSPPFDNENRWIWYIDPEIGRFFWSRIEMIDAGALRVTGFQEGTFRKSE